MADNIIVRQAEARDVRRICEINKSALGYDYALADTRMRLEDILSRGDDRVWVACRGGVVVGYIHGGGYRCTYCAPLKNVLALAVDEKHRGQGVGLLLLTELETWAKEEGCAGVRLVSGMDRQGAHAFYLRCGYALRKEQKNFIRYL